MILVDTSIIADIFTRDPVWFDWSSEQIEQWADSGPVCFDTVVFAELAVKFDSQNNSNTGCPPSPICRYRSTRPFRPVRLLKSIAAAVARRPDLCRIFLSEHTPT
jgi:hypothetical protein